MLKQLSIFFQARFRSHVALACAVVGLVSCASVDKTKFATSTDERASSASNPSAGEPPDPKPTLLFSDACRDWKAIGADEALKSGFYKKDGTTVFVESSTHMFVTVEGKSAPFYSDASSEEWAFTATSSGFNSIGKERTLGSPEPKPALTLRDLLQSSEELSLKTQIMNRWIPILLEGEAKFAVVLQSDTCAAAPQAKYVTCSVGANECAFFPKAFDLADEDRAAKQCLVDLKMGAPEKVQPLVKACEYFQSATYEERLRKAIEGGSKCGPKAEKAVKSLPTLKRIETTCLSVPQALLELTGSR